MQRSSEELHAGNCLIITNLLMFDGAMRLSPHSFRVTGIATRMIGEWILLESSSL